MNNTDAVVPDVDGRPDVVRGHFSEKTKFLLVKFKKLTKNHSPTSRIISFCVRTKPLWIARQT